MVSSKRTSAFVVLNHVRMRADSTPAPQELLVAAEVFRLLADPTRVRLLHALPVFGQDVGTSGRLLT